MRRKFVRRELGLIFGLTLGLALSARQAAAITLGMVADNSTNSVTVFNADTDTIIGNVPVPNPQVVMGDCEISVDRHTGYVTNFNKQVYQIDLTQSPPALRTGVNPIVISNQGLDLSLSPRGEYLLACSSDSSTTQPLSVILTQKRLEIQTFNLGSDCDSVDACPNSGSTNSSVLATSFNAKNVRRLKIDSSGKLVDTGGVFSPGFSPSNVNCAPQGTTGIVLPQGGGANNTIKSFTIPGMAAVDSKTVSGNGVISGAFNPAGTVFYVRSGSGAGFVDAFTFNPTTGIFGATPAFPAIAVTGAGFGFVGIEYMAVNPAGTKLYVSVANGLAVYNATTGALITTITSGNIVAPTGVCVR